jgi:hypothetical protein
MNAKQSALTAIVIFSTFSGGYLIGRNRPPEIQVLVVPSPEVIDLLKKRVNDENLVGVIDDLDPMTRKDMVFQMWSAEQAMATSILNSDTGHVFGPIGVGVSPLAVLKEQEEFMKRWLADYEKMAKDHYLKRKSKGGKADD